MTSADHIRKARYEISRGYLEEDDALLRGHLSQMILTLDKYLRTLKQLPKLTEPIKPVPRHD